jgi:hypothetical protein
MKPPRTYATAAALRKALEDRLRRIAAAEHVDLTRLRRQLSFDRLLARLFHSEPAPWALKGGYALELGLRTARATLDIDLALQGGALPDASKRKVSQALREMLQGAASISLGDWLEYSVGLPVKDVEAAPCGGARFPVQARMDARIFARFHVDVGAGDAVMGPLEPVEGRDWLQFAGITAPSFRMIPREQQFAEKLHTYTLPRRATNSRVKDLIDLVLLIQSGNLADQRIAEAVRLTHQRRSGSRGALGRHVQRSPLSAAFGQEAHLWVGGPSSHTDCSANHRLVLLGLRPQILVCEDSPGRESGKTVWLWERNWPAVRAARAKPWCPIRTRAATPPSDSMTCSR